MRNVFYICNRKRCENCSEDCNYTLSEQFAKNPKGTRLFLEYQSGDIWKVEPPETDPKEQGKE